MYFCKGFEDSRIQGVELFFVHILLLCYLELRLLLTRILEPSNPYDPANSFGDDP